MATAYLYLDRRRQRMDGKSQFKLRIQDDGAASYISLGIYCNPDYWDPRFRHVDPRSPNGRRIDMVINRMLLDAEEVLLTVGRVPLAQKVEAITEALFPERSEAKRRKALTLLDVARRFRDMKTGATRQGYSALVSHLERFRPDTRLEEVGRVWLTEFDSYLSAGAKSVNGRAVYMRYLRAVFNFAIDEEMTANYPFRKFHIRTVRTAKRNLSADQLRELFTAEVEEWQEPYRDFFMLSFLLIGTNAKDILHLPPLASRQQRVEFHRAKTRKLYSILLQPEALELIERYRGKKHLLSLMDGRKDYREFVKMCNHALRLIGTTSRKGCRPEGTPLFPTITTYYARHSWATVAAELDIPKETIAAALGHDMGNTTTAIYIDYNQAKVDEANRRVIDYVLYGRR